MHLQGLCMYAPAKIKKGLFSKPPDDINKGQAGLIKF
jgi:hypothetical protein